MKDSIRKINIINLIKYHADNNDAGFRSEAYEFARYFDAIGDHQLSEHILALLSDVNTFVPQGNEYDSPYLSKVNLRTSTLPLPSRIKNDVIGIINSINHNSGVNKFIFEGRPGSGKTETVKHIARILERELYIVDFEMILDSKMGQTSKNLSNLFKELYSLPHPNKLIILFDELDALALDRISSNDVREMGRVTSSFLKGLDSLNESITVFATTNLFSKFDPAIVRRFDAIINFDRYTNSDLIDISEVILDNSLIKFKNHGRNKKLFQKIMSTMNPVMYPGDLKNLIKSSLSFSDPNNPYDYLGKLYVAINKNNEELDINILNSQGFTLREMEVLTNRSKSQIARELADS